VQPGIAIAKKFTSISELQLSGIVVMETWTVLTQSFCTVTDQLHWLLVSPPREHV
jgi:hypothetical protein